MSSRARSNRAGFTLVEILIGITLAAILAMSASLAASESYSAYKAARINNRIEASIRGATHRIYRELLNTGDDVLFPATLDDDFGADDLTFQVIADVVDDVIVWSQPLRLVFEYENGELDNGIDDDGNGLVDEGRLVLIRDDGGPTERRLVLAHHVREFLEGEDDNGIDDNGNGIIDEGGFNVHRVGDILTIRLTLEEPGVQTDFVTRTMSTSIRLRN